MAIERAKEFTYLMRKAETPGKRTFVLLHGSGGDETTLIDLARKIAPDATLIGVKGRVRQDGINRWYARVTATSFDQADIRSEAQAFADSLEEAAHKYQFELKDAVFLGYSNGANLIGALTLLDPELVKRAVLLRAMPVLEDTPSAKLAGTHILTIAGKSDKLYSPYATKLEGLLRDRGASVQSFLIDSDHMIGDQDAKLVRDWLTAEATPSAIMAVGLPDDGKRQR